MKKFNHALTVFSFILENSEYISQKFDYSTDDIEASIFFGDSSSENLPKTDKFMDIKGTFKLLDGKLYEMVNIAPPNTVPLQRSSGLFKLAGL